MEDIEVIYSNSDGALVLVGVEFIASEQLALADPAHSHDNNLVARALVFLQLADIHV